MQSRSENDDLSSTPTPIRRAGCLLLVILCGFARAVADDMSPSPAAYAFSDEIADSEVTSLEGLVESNRNLMQRMNRVLQENESLSQRVSQSDAENAILGRRLDELTDRFNALALRLPGPASSTDGLFPITASAVDQQLPSVTSETGAAAAPKPLESPFQNDDGLCLKSLFDSFNSPTGKKGKAWYEKMVIRGYSQIRFGRAVSQDPNGAAPFLFGDRSITGETGTFSVRRARLIIAEDVSDHLYFYFQSDFANNPADDSATNTLFAQIRDLYGDIYLDTTKINRLRVGQSKLPWGFEEMQSSGNRVPLDRSDAIDSGDSPNQRDLGVFYYWTPVEKQKLLKELVEGGLKGSGNYGIFAFGMYNGQGGSEVDLNRSLHTVSRFTWPFQLSSGQAVEMSLQGYFGQFVAAGTPIQPLGQGSSTVPAGTGYSGVREQRLAGSFVYYPQPWGFQTEWNVGQGPGLNDSQTAVVSRALEGGYAMVLYKLDTPRNGIFIPYARYQHYKGGYRSIANAPYGTHDEVSLGVEWQIRKELELVVEYGYVDGVNLNPSDVPGQASYGNFCGQILRTQLQINY